MVYVTLIILTNLPRGGHDMLVSTLRKMIGSIHVVEEGNFIRVEGLPTYQYINDLARIWRTSKIGLNMFSKVTSSYVVFHKFFLPEVIYTLEGALESPKGHGFNYRAIRKAVEELRRETWFKRTTERFPDILDFRQLDKLNVKLFETQLGFLNVYNEKVPQFNLNGYMLAADPGTGKTINSLALATCLEADCTVIISPKNALDRVWGATLSSIFKKPVSYWVSSSDEPLVMGKQFYVFHYEQLDRAVEFFRKARARKPVVILDECHNMNEIDSLRTQLFVELCKVLVTQHVLWMSGTPIKAIGKEVVPLLKTIDPFFDKNAEERFIAIFGKSSSKGLDILANRLGYLVHKVAKATVMKSEVERTELKVRTPTGAQFTLEAVSKEMRDFVEERMEYYRLNFSHYEAKYNLGMREHERMVGHDPRQRQQLETYKRYIQMIRTQYDPESMKEESKFCNRYEAKEIIPYLAQPLKEEFRNAKSVVKYYNLKVQGEALGRILGKRRMQCNLDLAIHADFEPIIDEARKKTVIFTSYIEVVDRIYEDLVEKGYKPLRVYGATNHDLANIVKTFEKDPDANPLIATFQSLSTAVPLVMASTAVMMNRPFRSGELDQTEARIDRVGQDGAVRFVSMVLDTDGEPNLSTRSDDIMEWSRKQVEQIMGTPVTDELALEGYHDIVTLAMESDVDNDSVLLEVFTNREHPSPAVSLPIYTRW
jgi:SNF2 family DNA or RNA helicase